ncbi:MAG: ParA family protein [Nitrososphaerales archaeon]
MPTIISVANEKGGVGKTDLSVNLSSCLARAISREILLIDLDPQANTTRYLIKEESELTSADLLIDPAINIDDLAIQTNVPGLSLIPASKGLSAVQLRIATDADMQFKLKRKLSLLTDRYQLIFIDTPPSLGVLTINALAASNFVIVPVQTHYFPLYGLSDLMETIDKLKFEINPSLELLGIVLTMYDKRTRIAREIADTIRERFDGKLFSTKIPVCVKTAESPSHHKPVMTYAPSSSITQSYKSLSEEFLKCLEGCKITPCTMK